jgi:hypothetical protein
MESLPCKGCKGMCCGCGPVPITEDELKKMIIKPYLEVSKNHKYCTARANYSYNGAK